MQRKGKEQMDVVRILMKISRAMRESTTEGAALGLVVSEQRLCLDLCFLAGTWSVLLHLLHLFHVVGHVLDVQYFPRIRGSKNVLDGSQECSSLKKDSNIGEKVVEFRIE